MSKQQTVQEDNDMKSQDEVRDAADETAAVDSEACPHREGPADEEAARGDKLVPVSEAKRYRKRAQAAEKILAEVNGELAQKDRTLQEQQQVIDDLRQQRQIDQVLLEADAIDLDAATVLTDLALAEMEEPDVQQAVRELRRRKPFLFRSTRRGATALGPKSEHDGSPGLEARERAAVEAQATGSRRDLLRYLRLRRKTS